MDDPSHLLKKLNDLDLNINPQYLSNLTQYDKIEIEQGILDSSYRGTEIIEQILRKKNLL